LGKENLDKSERGVWSEAWFLTQKSNEEQEEQDTKWNVSTSVQNCQNYVWEINLIATWFHHNQTGEQLSETEQVQKGETERDKIVVCAVKIEERVNL
jgi:hypothetical protein